MNFLFWNIKARDLSVTIRDLVGLHDIDILLLAECDIPIASILEQLNPVGSARWSYAPSLDFTKTDVFVRGPASFVRPKYDLERLSIREIAFPGIPPVLMGVAHLASLLWYDADDQASEARELSEALRLIEKDVGHTRTIVVGDLNMSPYDRGLTEANGFNAVMTREIAIQEEREKAGKFYPYFFNPMWSLYNDGADEAPGTFFSAPPGYPSVHWKIIDQVLIRPRLLPFFRTDSVEILRACGSVSLANKNGRPESSDHFPIKFSLEF